MEVAIWQGLSFGIKVQACASSLLGVLHACAEKRVFEQHDAIFEERLSYYAWLAVVNALSGADFKHGNAKVLFTQKLCGRIEIIAEYARQTSSISFSLSAIILSISLIFASVSFWASSSRLF